MFTGDYASYASVPATEGADVEAAVYDEDNTQYMNVELGGTNQFRSGFYQYNLIYTIKDYTSGNELAKFRVYRDQIYPVDCTEEVLNNYLVTSACTFEEVSNTDGVCEKATLRFKLPENGLTLSYQSERLYIPVTVKQFVKDTNGDYQPANNDFTATMTKYFENASGISETAQNKYFAKDSTLIGSYGLNTAANSAFADTLTVTGAEETHYMLIENLSSWQGFYIMPNAPAHYMVSNPAIDQKSYNRLNTANSWDGYMTSDTETYVDGSGYRVRYHAENKSGMSLNGEIQSHMGAQRVEVSLYYEPTEDYFTQFHYDNGNADYKPLVTLKGTFQNETSNTVTMTNSKSTVQTAVYDKNSTEPKLLTVEIGGGSESNSIFRQTNLVYTLTDKTTGDELLKFRIYRGQVEPIEGYTQAQFEKYISSATVEGYNTDSYSGLLEKATLQIKVPQNGLTMTYTPETSYLPVTVKQYVLDSEGNVTEAGESFSSTVTKYYTSSDDLGKKKYFYKTPGVADTYKMWNASESEFVDNYTVTGASDTHHMIFINTYSGLYINPTAPQGYALATVQGRAFNPAGDEITNEYHKQQWTNIPTDHNNNGYLITHNYSSYAYLRGATLEVDVYYRPLTTLTIKQEMDGDLGNSNSTELAKVTITNTGTLASPYKAYIDLDSKLVDSVTLTDTKSNMTETNDDHIGSLFRTSVLGAHKGVLPQIKIEPKGARNVSSVKIYKKNGSEYAEVPAANFTVKGDGKVNSYITYTFKNAVKFGDDYLVEIVYGRQQNLTVKAVLRDAGGTETEVNSEELYAQSCLDVITVTGQRFNASGENIDDKAFSDINNTSESFNSFTLTTASKTVNSATNTRVTIDTSFKANSEYVIANIIAYNDSGDKLSLVVPGTKEKDGKSGTTYEKVTISDHSYDNKYSDVKAPIANGTYTGKWEFSSATSADDRYYHFIPDGGSITVEADKSYRAVVLYDLITVYSYTNYGGYVKQYLYYGNKEPKDINMSGENSADYTVLTGNNRFADQTVNSKTKAYYVLVSDLPKEDLSLNSASFEDYIEGAGSVDIKQDMLNSYTTRRHNGITKCYYFYEINPSDTHPVDNSMRLYSYFTMRRDDPPVVEESLDCDIYVEQWNRDTYDGNYVAASNQKVSFSVKEGDVLKLGSRAGEDRNPIEITDATGYMYSNRKQVLTIKPTPAQGYNVEKVVITDYGTGTYYPDSNGEINHTLGSSNVTIKVYYSRPLLRISSTNEGNRGKATVDVYNRTTDSMETVLTENKFTNGTFVTKGDDAEVIIKPLTYEDDGKDYYYTVASIRIGDAYNNTLTAYTENGGDVEGDDFTIEKMADGSQYKLTINNQSLIISKSSLRTCFSQATLRKASTWNMTMTETRLTSTIIKG